MTSTQYCEMFQDDTPPKLSRHDPEKELKRHKLAVEMLVAAGFLSRAKYDEALAFVLKFHG